jgi:hypothetical protein
VVRLGDEAVIWTAGIQCFDLISGDRKRQVSRESGRELMRGRERRGEGHSAELRLSRDDSLFAPRQLCPSFRLLDQASQPRQPDEETTMAEHYADHLRSRGGEK